LVLIHLHLIMYMVALGLLQHPFLKNVLLHLLMVCSMATMLRFLHMDKNGCSVLKELPEELCQLKFIQRLDLSCCTAFERLPHRFMELVSLRYLNLEKCENIVKLPEGFGKLSSLQELYLNSCAKLKELSGDFEYLLNLRNMEERSWEWVISCCRPFQ
jgi:hypothetical protein